MLAAALAALTAAVGAPAAPPRTELVSRLDRIAARIEEAERLANGGALPSTFDDTLLSLNASVAQLGHALPQLGDGRARASIVYYALRAADRNLALARRQIARRSSPEPFVRRATRNLGTVIAELARDDSMAPIRHAFESLSQDVQHVTPATPDRQVWLLMQTKERLLEQLPHAGPVAFGQAYVEFGNLYSQIGHAIRTSREREIDLVQRDLRRARRTAARLRAMFAQ
jgi:hypothetical protein